MSLSTGAKIGPYTIGDEIGAGGMGVVYRATDQNLKRDVAIKALPESFSADADWIARFEREAQTLAALNHPNIAQIYGLEKSDGTTALVMELVEGLTLADRIADGPLPPDEALAIAMQIADALEAAHGQGIVHRDLKPANIKLKPDGTVKVLDFGIAKTLDIRAASGQPAAMTTPAMTQTGIILGTAAYMSPEQARGRPIDQRTDIWAFGCLLYEMLTGQPAFAGEDVAITLARILANDTNMKSLPSVISPAVRHTIEFCLQKDDRKRIADIRDVKLAIEGAFMSAAPRADVDATVRSGRWRQPLPVATVTAIVTGVLFVLAQFMFEPPPVPIAPSPIDRFDYDLPQGQVLRQTGRRALAISPDGRQFVYNTQVGVYLRALDTLEPRLISGTERIATNLEFSPDGQALVYWDGQLRRISVSGGAPVFIAEANQNPFQLSWEADGSVLFNQADGILRVAATGGTPELIIPQDGLAYNSPQLLPDGDSILFGAGEPGSWDAGQIVVQSLTSGERKVLVEGGSDARYVPTGHIVYALGDGLFGVAFDIESKTVSGGAVPLVQDVLRANTSGVAQFDLSEDGTLVYLQGAYEEVRNALVWVDRAGEEQPLSLPPRAYTNARISPDGTRVALDVRDQEFDIWVLDLERTNFMRLTFAAEQDEFPVWSPDGTRIAFSRNPRGTSDTNLYWRAADGTGTPEQLAEGDRQLFPTAYLPDSTGIVLFGAETGNGVDDIAVFRFDADGDPMPLLNEAAYSELYPALSPDGQWLAYVSNESGREEVYVRPFPNIDGGRWQLSTDGGTQPLWARDGSEIYYRGSGSVMAVSVQTDPAFVPGQPEALFEDGYLVANGGPNYDVSPDGRFLMIREAVSPSGTSPQIIIVQNWFEELERLVPSQ
jgi:Tol biopolymer transport system component